MAAHHKQGMGKWYNTYKGSSCDKLPPPKKDFVTPLLLLFQCKRASHPKIFDYFTSCRSDKSHKCFMTGDWEFFYQLSDCWLGLDQISQCGRKQYQ